MDLRLRKRRFYLGALWALLVPAWSPLFSGGSVWAQNSKLTPVNLTLGMRSEPLGIETDALKFGWNLEAANPAIRAQRQTAYRILVASSSRGLARHNADIWDSGRVQSSIFWQLPYGGPSLHAHTIYYWQAQVWNGNSIVGSWSRVARFTTGLLSSGDWVARWIAAGPDAESPAKADALRLPVFRHDFTLHAPVESALLFISGLGQYELHLNGSNVTETVMNPGWTNYRKTVPYDTYNVTSLVNRGSNAFGILLGNGMYNVEDVKGRYTKFSASFGRPKCRLQLEVRYKDGSSERIMSDRSWLTHAGPITFSSIYGGEDEDASVVPPGWDLPGFQWQGWKPATEVSGPGGSMVSEKSAPMVIAETLHPLTVKTPKPGVTVYDLGKNISGWPDITLRGERGAKVTMVPGELLAADGTVSQRSTNAFPNSAVLFHYTLLGRRSQESWHPRFSYHSFRYVQVNVEPAIPGGSLPTVLSLAGDFVHARSPVVGEFTSSNDLFNRIHQLIDRAVLSNLATVVTDCPSREKLGWLEQTYLNAGTLFFNYDVARLYEKMSGDIVDAQLDDGLVPSTAPEFVAFVDRTGKSNAFRDSPEWGSAVILSPWELYQFTGDMQPLVRNYTTMQRYAAYLESRTVGGLLNYGLGDWYDIGPKPPGPSQLTGREITATAIYYEDLSVLGHVAQLLGHSAEAEHYTQKAAELRTIFNAKLFHPETDQYDRGSQTANAIPLALGLVPQGHVSAVLNNLVADIHAHGDHVTSGDVGFHYVVRALTDQGRSDVLAAMFSRTDSPSYGYQLARGATTLTEAWDANPESSQNHFMLGHGEEWFYRGLAGLSVEMARGQEDAIALKPSFLRSIGSASASYQSAMGAVSVAWRQTGSEAAVDITIPVGAQAHLLLPQGEPWHENAEGSARSSGILSSKADTSGTALTLGSGSYHFFSAQLQQAAPKETRNNK